MVDREKVIKGLERFFDCYAKNEQCTPECPYYDCDSKNGCYQSVYDAIELLKQQEAKLQQLRRVAKMEWLTGKR